VELIGDRGERPASLSVRPIKGGELMFEHLRDDFEVLGQRCFGVSFQLRLIFKPPRKPAPLEYSFWKDFLPGGLPETNRRRF
jgi:hypothetical protein